MTNQPAVWIDGHPQLEAIAAAVWEHCETEGTMSLIVDDPRNIAVAALAAVLPAPTDQAAEAVLQRVRKYLEARLDQVAVDPAEVYNLLAELPLSPYYEHPECGFHWHGRDGMDIPMRDGEPVCPRCELRRVEKRLAHFERRCVELREESLRRGKNVLEGSEKIRALEREIDGVRRELGAEILRANDAEAELRRLAGEARQDQHSCGNCESVVPATCIANPDQAREAQQDPTQDGMSVCGRCPHGPAAHNVSGCIECPGGWRADHRFSPAAVARPGQPDTDNEAQS